MGDVFQSVGGEVCVVGVGVGVGLAVGGYCISQQHMKSSMLR